MSKKVGHCLECQYELIGGSGKHGYHPECFQKLFALKDVKSDFDELLLSESEETAGRKTESRIGSSFFHGAFKKYSTRIENKKYILKVQEKSCPDLPVVEYICNLIARSLGIEVPDFYFVMLNNKLPTFVTRNILDFYDRSNLVHIWHYLKVVGQVELRELSLKNLIQIIEEETKRPIDVKNFIEICLFDMFIGNHDRHGRNLALIERQGSKILCPFYDNPSYVGILDSAMLGMQVNACGKIYTEKTQEPLINDYIEEFIEMGYQEIVDSFLKKLKKYDIEKAFSEIRIPLKRKKALIQMIEKNRVRI
jgi:hypothetical protein